MTTNEPYVLVKSDPTSPGRYLITQFLIKAPFVPGRIYSLQELGFLTDPCPPKRFLKSLGLKAPDGIISGDEVLAGMADKATRSLCQPTGHSQDPRRVKTLNRLDTKTIMTRRERRR